MIPSEIRAGIYQHYRGEHYLVLGLAHHSETMEKLVVYVPLYVREGPRMAVRPAEMFFGTVDEVCPNCDRSHAGIGTEQRDEGWYCGVCRRPYTPAIERFRYIGAEMPGDGAGAAARSGARRTNHDEPTAVEIIARGGGASEADHAAD